MNTTASQGVVCDDFNHHQVRNLGRADGHSAVKKAAYITGENLQDEAVGLSYGRPKSSGAVVAHETIGPKAAKGAAPVQWTPGQLWNAAEKAETRKNSRVAEEHIVALPADLDRDAHKRLLRGYTLWNRERFNIAGTWALHDPPPGGNAKNHHGHILFPTRTVSVGPNGEPVMGEKVREIHGKKDQARAVMEERRAKWAALVNSEMERAGLVQRLDHRSFERRAEAGQAPKGLVPGEHLGAKRAAFTRKAKGRDYARAVKDQDEQRRRANRRRVFEWQREAGDGLVAAAAPKASTPPVPTAPAGRSGPGGAEAPKPARTLSVLDLLSPEDRIRAVARERQERYGVQRAIIKEAAAAAARGREAERDDEERQRAIDNEANAADRHRQREQRADDEWKRKQEQSDAAWRRKQRRNDDEER